MHLLTPELQREALLNIRENLVNHEFPDEEKLQAIRTRISDYLMSMNENR